MASSTPSFTPLPESLMPPKGASATATTVVAGDQVILNDNGTMKQVAIPDIGTYITGALALNSLSDVLIEATSSMYIGNDPSGTTSSADYNLGMGVTALDAITTGDSNIALGHDALTAMLTGSNNIAIGKGALDASDAESNNLAIGLDALGGAITSDGVKNVAIGN